LSVKVKQDRFYFGHL